MANFGELVLVLGDIHIPERTSKIPAPFKRMLVPNKMQHVFCTGNVSVEQYEDLRNLAPNLHVAAGDYDDTSGTENGLEPVFPETHVVQVGAFRIGVIHGHQLLPWNNSESIDRMQRKLRVDILITGHTHQSEVNIKDNYYHINPGSITGAYSTITENVIPSFILLAVQDTKVTCYVYELIKGEVEVSKTEFTKKTTETLPTSTNPALLDSLLK